MKYTQLFDCDLLVRLVAVLRHLRIAPVIDNELRYRVRSRPGKPSSMMMNNHFRGCCFALCCVVQCADLHDFDNLLPTKET